MCYDCWTGFGSPVEFTATTEATAALVSKLYEIAIYGGNLHVVIDDWNIDDDDLARCRRTSRRSKTAAATRRLAMTPTRNKSPSSPQSLATWRR
jgi:hypothetical protein